MKPRKLELRSETMRVLVTSELERIHGAQPDESIVYGCPTNTSIMRSCYQQSCAPSGYYVCPMKHD